MTSYTRRQTLQLLSSFTAAAAVCPTSSLFAQPAESNPSIDWSQAVVNSTMSRIPEPAQLGRWGYAVSLFLYGTYLVYQRTREQRLLTYIQGWVGSHVSAAGQIDHSITALDYMLPGNLLLGLHKETGQQKYRAAADRIRHTFDSYREHRMQACGTPTLASTSSGWMACICRCRSSSVMVSLSMTVTTRLTKPQINCSSMPAI